MKSTPEDVLLQAIRERIADPMRRIDMDTLAAPPLFPRATAAEVERAEGALGLTLPPLLRRLYQEVGNGGFGPGAGILGLDGGYLSCDGQSLVDLYLEYRGHGWPDGLLPLCDWGDAARSCVDARSRDQRMVTQDERGGVTRTKYTLEEWLEAWVQGVEMERETFEFERGEMNNPFTKQVITVSRRVRAKSR